MLQAFRSKDKSKEESFEYFLQKLEANKKVKQIIQSGSNINLSTVNHKYTICNLCENKATYQCGKCKITRYCSKECQIEDWERHKKICKKLF
jgi:plasmid rolling circle replication initiator protein Rep